MGHAGRPAGGDRPGLNARASLPARGDRCRLRTGRLRVLLGRRLPRQQRASLRRDAPALLGALRPLPVDAAVRLRRACALLRFRRGRFARWSRQDRPAWRSSSRRDCLRAMALPAPARRRAMQRRVAGGGVSDMAATFTPRRRARRPASPELASRRPADGSCRCAARIQQASRLRRFCRDFRLHRFGRRGLFDLQRGQFFRLSTARYRHGASRSGSSRLRASRPAPNLSGAFSATSGSTRSRASVGAGGSFAGRTPVRAAAAATGCWQIAHARRAAAPPHQARRSEPTSTARSRRTESENRGAWTRVPPCRERAGLLMPKGTR